MIITHNISALNIVNRLNQNNKMSESTLDKLTSGLRINKAADDAAGLAISEKMRGQIRGLNMAGKNVQDGISLIQTAESGLDTIGSHSLTRLRELAIKAANDTLTDNDRRLVQLEVSQIKDGINEIAKSTAFNGINLLNRIASTVTSTETVTTTTIVDETVVIISPGIVLLPRIPGNPKEGDLIGLGPYPTIHNDGRIVFVFSNPPSDPNHIYVPIGADIEETLSNMKGIFDAIQSGTGGTVAQQNLISDSNMKFEIYGNRFVMIADEVMMPHHKNADVFWGWSTHAVGQPVTIDYEIEVTETTTITNTIITRDDITLQIGANSGDSLSIELSNVTTTELRINNIDLSTRQGAHSAISEIDEAIAKVSAERSKFGAYHNRLEHNYNSITNTAVNLQSAESRIRDTDIAKEMMSYTKSNILIQASQAMLAQANQKSVGVLQLLK